MTAGRWPFLKSKQWAMRLYVSAEWTPHFTAPEVKNTSRIIRPQPSLADSPSITITCLKQPPGGDWGTAVARTAVSTIVSKTSLLLKERFKKKKHCKRVPLGADHNLGKLSHWPYFQIMCYQQRCFALVAEFYQFVFSFICLLFRREKHFHLHRQPKRAVSRVSGMIQVHRVKRNQ